MSNKLIKEKPLKKLNKFHILLFVAFIIAFIVNWVDVFLTTSRFNRQLDEMIEGIDYYVEDITLIKKDCESYYSTPDTVVETTNYYFYYDYGSPKKMFVDRETYGQYAVGDKVPAYTIDHINYGYTKESLLPDNDHTNNEIKKAIGILLGISNIVYGVWIWITYKGY